MKKKSIFHYYSKFSKRILSTRFLNKLGFDKNIIENTIKHNDFVNEFGKIFYQEDFSCKKVAEIFILIFQKEYKKDFPVWNTEEWIRYIYGYILSKSFKEAVQVQLNPVLNRYCDFYLRLLKIFNEFEKDLNTGSFISKYPLHFLTDTEKSELEYSEEYLKFITAFEEEFIYELMKLNKEITGFNTLDHICGVHFLTLYIARQIKSKNISVDLGRVSGSAAGHDIGKFGCKGEELKRVPYLHYYYTDQWFLKHGIHYIRNIALNHSTWDLELENLPLESLILIYCDFRVKNKDGTSSMNIYSLKDSFDIILNKLDNLDEAKEKRYKKVYSKLVDFEMFLKTSGIVVDPLEETEPKIREDIRENALLQGNNITEKIKYIAIKHNISLMYHLRDEYSLESILEVARSEKNWKRLREYIRIFEEYSTYLTQKQKLQTLKFLYDNLTHPEDDIRRHCAEIIGTLIAYFDEDYRKEIPGNVSIDSPPYSSYMLLEEYINKLLYPSHKVIPQHRYWMGYNLSLVCKSLFDNRKKANKEYRDIFIKYFDVKKIKNSDMHLFLLQCIKYLPLVPMDEHTEFLIDFIFESLNKKAMSIKLCAMENLIDIIKKNPSELLIQRARHFTSDIKFQTLIPSEAFLVHKLENLLHPSYQPQPNNLSNKFMSGIYLNNLKSATDWVVKKNNILMLLDIALNNPETNSLQTAIHLSNLLKVSAVESVRNQAGKAIVKLMPKLSSFEKNEVSVELLRALEMEGHKFTEYIPAYLGQILLFLDENEFEEILDDLIIKIKISTASVKTLILKTVSITIQHYLVKVDMEQEKNKLKLTKLLSILLNALGDYDSQVSMSAFSYFAKGIFQSSYLDFDQKHYIYTLTAKKILTLITPGDENDLLMLSNSAALNHIYRFISDYNFHFGEIKLGIPSKVAFFPGTFDPFSLSHKEIAVKIRDLGYEVYLAVDEFSWSKRTLPNLIRRNIIKMSIASELNIYIYPDNLPVNISNSEDLNALKNSFPNSEVYIVTGSDVILNASSYRNLSDESSISNFSHLVIDRGRGHELSDKLKDIKGNIEILNLSNKYKSISSTQIRTYIDDNKDISSLIDPLSQKYIYENGFYQREPMDKNQFTAAELEVEVLEDINTNLLEVLQKEFSLNKKVSADISSVFSNDSSRILLLKETGKKKMVGVSVFHWVRTDNIFSEIRNVALSQHIRENTSGRIISLDALIVKDSDKSNYHEQILLSETLAFSLSRDYQFALCSLKEKMHSQSLKEHLRLFGFKSIDSQEPSGELWLVNMSTPCVINYDLENFIKEPFKSSVKIKQSIQKSRKKLQESLCRLYPGELVLPIDNSMLHNGLIKKICRLNKVPEIAVEISNYGKANFRSKTGNINIGDKSKTLGDLMCVPYGDILDRYVIPNTITKSLHTEKYFNASMEGFKIDSFPYFLSLENQIRMIKSFNKSVILVDTILHKGYRMKALDPLFKKESINIEKIVVGILSARGRDLMQYQNREVEAVYFIPRLRLWFNESSMYPFIGGDSLWRGRIPERNLIPSINLILPYTSPAFIRDSNKEAILELSKTCIENSINILSSLETLFHKINERNLSLISLGQVITTPRYPDHGKDIIYDLNLTPTHYLKNDLELLSRLSSIIRS